MPPESRVQSPESRVVVVVVVVVVVTFGLGAVCVCFFSLAKCYGTVSHVESVLVVLDSIAVMSRG